MSKLRMSLPAVVIAFASALNMPAANAQAPDANAGAGALKQTMIAAAGSFGLSAKDSGPFHLKAHFDTFDADGKPDGSGTLEEFSDGKERLRRDFVYRGATTTTWRTPKEFTTGSTLNSSYMQQKLFVGFERPFPPSFLIERSAVTDTRQAVGSVPMHCIVVRDQPPPLPGKPTVDSGSIPPETYCLSDNDRFLRTEQSFGNIGLIYNKLRPFGGKAVPYSVSLVQGKTQRGQFDVDTLEAWTPEDATLTPPPDAKEAPAEGQAIRIQGGVVAGNVIYKTEPSYPAMARSRHLSGDVNLSAIITKEGTVKDLQVISSPDPSLSQAAMDAVKQWRYKPYMLAGFPVEVNTTITINFRIFSSGTMGPLSPSPLGPAQPY